MEQAPPHPFSSYITSIKLYSSVQGINIPPTIKAWFFCKEGKQVQPPRGLDHAGLLSCHLSFNCKCPISTTLATSQLCTAHPARSPTPPKLFIAGFGIDLHCLAAGRTGWFWLGSSEPLGWRCWREAKAGASTGGRRGCRDGQYNPPQALGSSSSGVCKAQPVDPPWCPSARPLWLIIPHGPMLPLCPPAATTASPASAPPAPCSYQRVPQPHSGPSSDPPILRLGTATCWAPSCHPLPHTWWGVTHPGAGGTCSSRGGKKKKKRRKRSPAWSSGCQVPASLLSSQK